MQITQVICRALNYICDRRWIAIRASEVLNHKRCIFIAPISSLRYTTHRVFPRADGTIMLLLFVKIQDSYKLHSHVIVKLIGNLIKCKENPKTWNLCEVIPLNFDTWKITILFIIIYLFTSINYKNLVSDWIHSLDYTIRQLPNETTNNPQMTKVCACNAA